MGAMHTDQATMLQMVNIYFLNLFMAVLGNIACNFKKMSYTSARSI